MYSRIVDDVRVMRTSIEIDDRLMREAMRCSGARTSVAAVEAGLRLLVRTHKQAPSASSGAK
jgi:Arc/MetJ family transcription regulator